MKKTGDQLNMRKIIALSSLLALGALGMACGDAANTNTASNANANRTANNAMATANNAMQTANNAVANAANQVANATNAASNAVSNAVRPATTNTNANANANANRRP